MVHQFMKIGLTLLGFFIAVMVTGQGHEISITMKGSQEESIIVGYHFGKQRLVLDTIAVVDESILIQGENSLTTGVYFIYSPKVYFEFLVEEQNFSMSFDVSDPYQTLSIIGSRENELFRAFQSQMGLYQRQQRAFSDSLTRISGEDSIAVRDQLLTIGSDMSAFRKSMVETNKGTFFSEFISLMIGIEVPTFDSISDQGERRLAQYDYYRSNYMQLVSKPGRLMRTPVIHEYVMKYFNEMVVPQADSTILAIDTFMESTLSDPSAFRYWLVTLFDTYQSSKIMGMDAVTVHMADKYYLSGMADWITEETKSDISKELRFIRPNLIGKPAPELVLTDTADRPITLAQIDNPFIILYFYDPDCGVCRKKTPLLLADYTELQNEGAEVLAVCTTTDLQKWKEYVTKNELIWWNGSDPKARSNFRVDYNVRSTPKVYVLDKQRNIIAKNLDVTQLLGFIQDHKRLVQP
jgi:peroxiredoxin